MARQFRRRRPQQVNLNEGSGGPLYALTQAGPVDDHFSLLRAAKRCRMAAFSVHRTLNHSFFSAGWPRDEVRNRGEADETLQSSDADAAIARWNAGLADGYERKLNE